MQPTMTRETLIQQAQMILQGEMHDGATRIVFDTVVTRWNDEEFEIGTIKGLNTMCSEHAAEEIVDRSPLSGVTSRFPMRLNWSSTPPS